MIAGEAPPDRKQQPGGKMDVLGHWRGGQLLLLGTPTARELGDADPFPQALIKRLKCPVRGLEWKQQAPAFDYRPVTCDKTTGRNRPCTFHLERIPHRDRVRACALGYTHDGLKVRSEAS